LFGRPSSLLPSIRSDTPFVLNIFTTNRYNRDTIPCSAHFIPSGPSLLDHPKMADTAAASNLPSDAAKHKRTASSVVAGIYTAAEIESEGKSLEISKDVQRLNWKINTSPATLQEPDILKKMVTTPPMSKLELKFPTGLTVTTRNKKGVTVKDCLDAIWKQYRKKADDELDLPILSNFIFDKEDYGCGTLGVLLKKTSDAPQKKKKDK